MKTTVAMSLAAMALLAAACHKAQDQDSASAGGEQSDGGDKITLAQYQARQVERIMRNDANQDGKVSKDEFTAAMKARMAQFSGGGDNGDGQAPDPATIADRVFARMDVNKDGFITKDEVMKSSAERFDRLDADHKGYLTRDQLRPPGGFGGGQGGGGGGQGGGDNGGGGGGGGGNG